MELKFKGKIIQNGDMDAGFVIVPYDIKEIYGKGRLLVHATFDGYPYDGQVVKMGSPDYIIGIRKDIRKKIGKSFGDQVEVTIKERKKEEKSMWTCPKCGRKFKNKNQSHYCGTKPTNICQYIESQDENKKEELKKLYNILKEELPKAGEKISRSMPTFFGKKNIIHFAAHKNHLGLYPGPRVIEDLQEELKGYKTSKGAIQIPYGKIDEKLIRKIARLALKYEEEEE
jgi:uncharacterized protein YdhG (YjbR/CyaY superfamily)